MIHHKVTELADLLRWAATGKHLVTYRRLHSCFEKNVPLNERYRLLEKAVHTLANPTLLDYGCLMSLANGLPGDDFFTRFKRLRAAEYLAEMGHGSLGRSTTKKRRIALLEREAVYRHATVRCDPPPAHAAAYSIKRDSASDLANPPTLR
ncbi:hypothetical protein [Caballeronia sp. LZ019]|uniref:hypothetical protein n=1 Tax=Caballeronia sp. LZ019 TaxID=3038555 RepID=UPI00285775CA|nr:hypothetical protein [Caballeronia sp. LZ019]MDR5809277.1 hypothetical protein [Caballeronia sp. LZ019]